MSVSKDSNHLIPSAHKHTTPTHTHHKTTCCTLDLHLIPSTHTHTIPTHTHHKTTCCTLTRPNLLHTVPHSTHTTHYRLARKIDGVTSIELKCEQFLKTQHVWERNSKCQNLNKRNLGYSYGFSEKSLR